MKHHKDNCHYYGEQDSFSPHSKECPACTCSLTSTPLPEPLSEATGTEFPEKEEWEEAKRKYPQEMLLMNDCPNCGQEVNRKFVENVIDEIVASAKEEERNECQTLLNSGRKMYEKGKEEERQEWLRRERCRSCVVEGDYDVRPVCAKCLEEA